MERDRRWRIRIRRLMLLIAITALASYIIVERWLREQEAQRRLAAMQRAAVEAAQARVQAQQIRAFPETGIESPPPDLRVWGAGLTGSRGKGTAEPGKSMDFQATTEWPRIIPYHPPGRHNLAFLGCLA